MIQEWQKKYVEIIFSALLNWNDRKSKKMLNKYLIVNSEVLYQVKTVNVFESNGPTRVKNTEKKSK